MTSNTNKPKRRIVRRDVAHQTVHFSAIDLIWNLYWPMLLLGVPTAWALALATYFLGKGGLPYFYVLAFSAIVAVSLRILAQGAHKLGTISDKTILNTRRGAWVLLVVPTIPFAFPYAGFLLIVSLFSPGILGELLSQFEESKSLLFFSTWFKYPLAPTATCIRLRALRTPTQGDHAPFLIIRNFNHTFFSKFSNPERVLEERAKHWTHDRWGFRHFLNAWAVAGLFFLVGAALARKKGAANEEFYRDYVTSPLRQKHAYSDGRDLPLRYRQSSTELDFRAEHGAPDHRVPKFVAISCMANVIKDPVWLLPVKSVFERIPDVVRDFERQGQTLPTEEEIKHLFHTLEDPHFEKFDKHTLVERKVNQAPAGYFERPNSELKGQPVARDIDPNRLWAVELALDINRIEIKDDYSEQYVHDTKRPLAILLEAIKRADEDGDAFRIVLNHGDLLLVDNRRALICRKEYARRHFVATFARIQTKRWLRLYYGFPVHSE